MCDNTSLRNSRKWLIMDPKFTEFIIIPIEGNYHQPPTFKLYMKYPSTSPTINFEWNSKPANTFLSFIAFK